MSEWHEKANQWIDEHSLVVDGVRDGVAELLRDLAFSEGERKSLQRAVDSYKRERSVARTRKALDAIDSALMGVGLGLVITLVDDTDGMRFVVRDTETRHEFQLVVDGGDA